MEKSVWKRRELALPAGSGAEPRAKYEFGYSTAVSIIILVAKMLLILRYMFYTRKLNTKVSYRK